RVLSADRCEAVHAHADRGHVAVFGHFDHLARDRLGLALEQVLHEDGRLVARSAWPAGRIGALAFLKLHGLILLSLGWTKAAARAARMRPARSSTRFRETRR